MEEPPRFELGNGGFADHCLTTWLWLPEGPGYVPNVGRSINAARPPSCHSANRANRRADAPSRRRNTARRNSEPVAARSAPRQEQCHGKLVHSADPTVTSDGSSHRGIIDSITWISERSELLHARSTSSSVAPQRDTQRRGVAGCPAFVMTPVGERDLSIVPRTCAEASRSSPRSRDRL